jgi:hypothetical protein
MWLHHVGSFFPLMKSVFADHPDSLNLSPKPTTERKNIETMKKERQSFFLQSKRCRRPVPVASPTVRVAGLCESKGETRSGAPMNNTAT